MTSTSLLFSICSPLTPYDSESHVRTGLGKPRHRGNISYCCCQRQRRYPHDTSNQAETHSDVQGDGKPAIRNKKECSRYEPKSTRTFLRGEEASRKAMSSLNVGNAQMTKDRDHDMSGSPSLSTGNTPSQTQNSSFSDKARPKERIPPCLREHSVVTSTYF